MKNKIKVTFLAKNIKVTKEIRADRVEAFRQNMLAKYDLLFKKAPHIIKIETFNLYSK